MRHGKLALVVQAAGDSLGAARIIKFDNPTFYGYIQILLIKTNSIIYICYIKHDRNVEICVLAVRDDELGVGDNKDMSWALGVMWIGMKLAIRQAGSRSSCLGS